MTNFSNLLAEHRNLLEQWNISKEQQNRLATWLEQIWQENQELNLFSRKLTAQTLVEEHLLDSLVGLPYLGDCQTVADLGTGGGFPAIALAICRPQTHFLLFEKSVLKTRYLQRVDLPNIEPAGPLQPKSLENPPDLVIARAFKPIRVIIDMTRSYHAGGGSYLLYKGRKVRIDEEIREARLAPDRVSIQALPTFGAIEERHLVMIR